MIHTTLIIEGPVQGIRFTFDQIKTQCMHLIGPNFTQIYENSQSIVSPETIWEHSKISHTPPKLKLKNT